MHGLLALAVSMPGVLKQFMLFSHEIFSSINTVLTYIFVLVLFSTPFWKLFFKIVLRCPTVNSWDCVTNTEI